MFNKKTYRIAKKLNKSQNNKKFLLLKNINKLIKNQKLKLFKKILFQKNNYFYYLFNKNVCSFTGKYKSVFNSLKLSRHSIRNLADISSLPNYSKLSWKCLNYIILKIKQK